MSDYAIEEDPHGMGRCFIPKGAWRQEYERVLKREMIAVLRLSRAAGWQGHHIGFIRSLPKLVGLEVYAWEVRDITPMAALVALRLIGLQCGFVSCPDFSAFRRLEVCKLFWRPGAETVFNCAALLHLNVVDFPGRDLSGLALLRRLGRLQLMSKSLSSVAGIEKLHALRTLDLADCPALRDLVPLEHRPELEMIEINRCRNLHSLALLAKLPNLKSLRLIDCDELDSLRFLEQARNLEELIVVGSSLVSDGDLRFLLALPQLRTIRFAKRPHYVPAAEVLNSHSSAS